MPATPVKCADCNAPLDSVFVHLINLGPGPKLYCDVCASMAQAVMNNPWFLEAHVEWERVQKHKRELIKGE